MSSLFYVSLSRLTYVGGVGAPTMSTQADTTQPDDDWLRNWTVPEEDRSKYTSEPWRGEARWFRAPNVVCLDLWRRQNGRLYDQRADQERVRPTSPMPG
jgi:hypothetical protein